MQCQFSCFSSVLCYCTTALLSSEGVHRRVPSSTVCSSVRPSSVVHRPSSKKPDFHKPSSELTPNFETKKYLSIISPEHLFCFSKFQILIFLMDIFRFRWHGSKSVKQHLLWKSVSDSLPKKHAHSSGRGRVSTKFVKIIVKFESLAFCRFVFLFL